MANTKKKNKNIINTRTKNIPKSIKNKVKQKLKNKLLMSIFLLPLLEER